MFFWAHFPKAAEAPVRFRSATSTPRMTRKMNTPAFPATDSMMPALMTVSSVPAKEKFVARSPPAMMPTKRAE